MLNKINTWISTNYNEEHKLTTKIYIEENQIIKCVHTNLREQIKMLVYCQKDNFKKEDLHSIVDDEVGLYFLINEKENTLYVGKTDNNFKDRLTNHIKSKKEFNKVLLFFFKTEDKKRKWSPTITAFLESWFINFFSDKKMFTLQNERNEQYKSWDESDEDKLTNAFKALKWLCLSENIILCDLNNSKNKESKNVNINSHLLSDKVEVFWQNVKAEYYFQAPKNKSLKLFKDTIIIKREFDKKNFENSSINIDAYNNWFNKQIIKGNLKPIDKDEYVIVKDIFTSTSSAACVIMGYFACNGKDAWTTIEGFTINQLLNKK